MPPPTEQLPKLNLLTYVFFSLVNTLNPQINATFLGHISSSSILFRMHSRDNSTNCFKRILTKTAFFSVLCVIIWQKMAKYIFKKLNEYIKYICTLIIYYYIHTINSHSMNQIFIMWWETIKIKQKQNSSRNYGRDGVL